MQIELHTCHFVTPSVLSANHRSVSTFIWAVSISTVKAKYAHADLSLGLDL